MKVNRLLFVVLLLIAVTSIMVAPAAFAQDDVVNLVD